MKYVWKKWVIILLAVLILPWITACGRDAGPVPAAAEGAKEQSAPDSRAESTEAEKAGASEEGAAEEETAISEKTVQKNGEIVILYTSDVHCGVKEGFGYAGLQQVRDYLVSQGNEVILLDNGDSIQGEAIGVVTKGEALIRLMNEIGYDIAIPGNHEFDYGMDRFLALTEMAEFPYISCNFNYKGELIFAPYLIRELAGRKIAFVGITTPGTLTSSTPQTFQDSNGNYVYGFMQDESGEKLYSAVQSAVDEARAEGAEFVVAMAHLGNNEACRPWTYADVIANTVGIDVLLDGHSHDTDQVTMKNKIGKTVLRSACGTKMECIGWCRIDAEGEKISGGLYTWNNDTAAPDLLGIQNEMFTAVSEAMEDLDQTMGTVVGTSSAELTINDPVAVNAAGRPVRMVRRAETNLGDFCTDAYRDQTGADIAVIGGGAIRACLPAGELTMGQILDMSPFNNSVSVIEVTGQQILDALEWGARGIPDEYGGFLQVSGLSYEIHSYIDTPCMVNSDGAYDGIKGERRVKNVRADGEAIDPEKTYSLAGQNYTLLNGGDGYTMFNGAKVLQDEAKMDIQALIDYITDTLGGTIGSEYEDPYGQGRIVIVEERP